MSIYISLHTGQTADLRKERDIARDMMSALHTIVKARMQQMSALQTEMSANKAELSATMYKQVGEG